MYFTGTPPDTNMSSDENRECAEDKYTDFSYPLTWTTIEHSEDFRIEIKICDNGTLLIACRCRWTSSYKPTCRHLINDSVCEADNSQMDLSLRVRRTYNEIRWLLFKQNSTPVVMKHTALQVTCKLVFETLNPLKAIETFQSSSYDLMTEYIL